MRMRGGFASLLFSGRPLPARVFCLLAKRLGRCFLIGLAKRFRLRLGHVGTFIQSEQHSHADDGCKDGRCGAQRIHLVVEPLPKRRLGRGLLESRQHLVGEPVKKTFLRFFFFL